MKAQVVSFHCVLKNKLGRIISSTFNSDVMTQSFSPTDVLQGLADGLQNLKKGEKRRIALSAEKAYGFYDPSKVIECEREDLPSNRNLKRGDQVLWRDKQGEKNPLRVIAIDGDLITLDGNHPLAGQDLIFEIEATEARDATLEELRLALDETVEVSPLH